MTSLVGSRPNRPGRRDPCCLRAGREGWGPGGRRAAAGVDRAGVGSTPGPPSTAVAHAAIGRFGRLAAPPRLRLLVNQARSAAEASDVLEGLVASSRQFLGAVVAPLGPGS